jgi:hypothetical protein
MEETMSEGKFDATINCLSVMADRDFANGAPHRGQFRAAIRVLEAAGKIEGPKILVQVIQDLATILEREGRTTFAQWLRKAVLPILSALPDEEPK